MIRDVHRVFSPILGRFDIIFAVSVRFNTFFAKFG